MPSEFARHWTLDPQIDFLNHGSFGACPRPVLEVQQELRARLERQPVQFMARDLEGLLDEARGALAAFVGADPDDLAFVANATTGVNTVVRSLRLEAGDELLTTDHAYNACRNALRVHEAAGVKVIAAQVPWPIASSTQVSDALLSRVTPRTRMVLLDHVTSPTGLIFPVAPIVRALNERGIDTLVDGAHAPGMLPLEVRAIGAAYYSGNCHKWLSAPKGSAFLHVRRDRQERVLPLVIGHGYNSTRTDRSRFRRLFDWDGTDDPTAFLCVPAAIRFLGGLLPGGWPALMEHNRSLALAGRRALCQALRIPEPAPAEMIGSLASVPLPYATQPSASWDPLQRTLSERHHVEVPVYSFPQYPRRLVRIAAQIYNSPDQYERLSTALTAEMSVSGGAGGG